MVFKNAFRAWALIIVLVVGVGCGGPGRTPGASGEETRPPTPSPVTPTASPRPAAGATRTPTAAVACRRPEADLETPEAVYLPDRPTWAWEDLPIPGEKIRHLVGLPFPVDHRVGRSPDGRWLIARLILNPGLFWGRAVALLDREDARHRWLVRLPVERQLYDWLPDGRPVWGYGRALYVGEPPAAQPLNPPAEMTQIWVAAGGILFARDGEGVLWRVKIGDGQWERVSGADSQGDRLGNSFWLAPDGTYGLADQSDGLEKLKIWRVPARMGAPAERVAEVKLTLQGREGSPEETMTQALGDPPYRYWYIFAPNWELGDGFILDLEGGRVLRPEDLGFSSSEVMFWRYFVHPSGRWVAMALAPAEGIEGPEDPRVMLYVAPVGEWRAGFQRRGVVWAGWLEEPPGLVVRAVGGEERWIWRLEPGGRVVEVPVMGVEGPIGSGGGRWWGVTLGARLVELTVEGQVRERLDLSPFYRQMEWIQGLGERVYLGAVLKEPAPDGTCRYALVEWQPNPEGGQGTK